ncbi:gamma-glutamyltransferase [Noviherbaspirillum sp. Root189]|uniref:gamma-glutamyltransferase n=1 Tax=Noviherbaspirillum sp. Root189 TaxID=1736487 RepID=UPI00070AA4BF|nr:gamma-glutamyltransferase [Noviherbaspirillum sp. Root189]KRB73512.1 gamma-glutamyltransferase [Noviherbaspirillum sp. Root189]
MIKTKISLLATASLLLVACASNQTAQQAAPATPVAPVVATSPAPGMQAPESASGFTDKPGWAAKKFMVAAANPLATEAGYRVLRVGGSAVDAAIAVQMVLGLVEPQSSGIAGGAFMMHFDGNTVKAFDGRETAPAAATERLFQTAEGKAMSFHEGVVGGRSVGAPGVLRMLELAHKQYGRLPWASLFAPAISLAERGFAVSPRLNAMLKTEQFLRKDPVAAAYFYDKDGNPWPVGHVLKNPELAQVLRDIAKGGADAFYTGQIARDIETKVKSHPTNPGLLTAADIAGYQAKVREPVCTDYKTWTVCGMPPPSSGGIAIAQMLGMLETKNMRALTPVNGALNADAIHLFSEAGRLAYADRGRYVADTDFVPLPGNSPKALVDKRYLAERAALITDKSMGVAKFGVPPATTLALGIDNSPELPSTSHISIVDAKGNAISMTTTIEDAFGSRQMVRGFLLNNQLTDFSFDPVDANGPVANRVQSGKRPRSSMAPTFVFERGTKKLVLSTGSPGGSAIINYVGKVLVGTLDWGLNVQQAISLPNFGSRNGPTELEQGRVSDALVEQLKAKGHNVRVMEQTSGLQGIMRMNIHGEEMWFGGADPRREGIVKGD